MDKYSIRTEEQIMKFNRETIAELQSDVTTCTGPLTALAGGGATDATLLTVGYNFIGVVTTSGDSFLLPPAVKNSVVICMTSPTFSYAGGFYDVYAQGDETIDDTDNDAFIVTLTPDNAALVIFMCPVDGAWYSSGGLLVGAALD